MTRRWCLLSDIAHAGLGYKSLQNTFFYLEPDDVRTYGIERRFLARIYLLDDLDSSTYCQHRAATLRVFRCGQAESDLAGTGALRYIRATGGTPAGKEQVIKNGDVRALADACVERLGTLVADFDDETRPYRAVRRARFDYRYDAFAHLARVAEWSGSNASEDEEAAE